MLLVAVHLAWALLLAACVFPLLGRAARLRVQQRWSRRLLALLGVRLRVSGGTPQPGELVVANHVSWLDIFVICAVRPGVFVAKADVRAWPLVGWVCERSGALFMARGSSRAAHGARARIAAALADGATVVVFPEGTTTDGRGVLPFHSALLQGALDVAAATRPLALRYVDARGCRSGVPAYCGETRLLASLWRIACAPTLSVDVTVLPQLRGGSADRHMLAAVARGMIAVAVEHGWHGAIRGSGAPPPLRQADAPCPSGC